MVSGDVVEASTSKEKTAMGEGEQMPNHRRRRPPDKIQNLREREKARKRKRGSTILAVQCRRSSSRCPISGKRKSEVVNVSSTRHPQFVTSIKQYNVRRRSPYMHEDTIKSKSNPQLHYRKYFNLRFSEMK
nr:putative B3 domain-containing protein Os03g0621600 isoform X3 [Ipomoea batatas]